MFEAGNYIICGQHGVCKVEEIGTLDMPGISKEKDYYILTQVYASGGKVYIPVDSQKINMRALLTKEEANVLVREIEDMEPLWVADDKRREDVFKEVLRSCDCREWVKIIKAIYARKESRIAEGKKITASDERYLHIAEEYLYGELAISLGMKMEQVEQFIIDQIEVEE